VLSNEAVEAIWKLCQKEHEDERFKRARHYSKGTYQAGCRGPMCRKVERDGMKRKQQRKPRPSGLPYRQQRMTEDECHYEDTLSDAIQYFRVLKNKPLAVTFTPRYPENYPGKVRESA
jgi:hypothetical protein